MEYLLDTNVWLRAALFAETLPSHLHRILGDPEITLGLSIYSLWEAAKKHQKGKLPLPMDLTKWLQASVPQNLRVLPLSAEIISESVRLPDFPVNDPGDELIVATARIHKLTLLTTDKKLKNYRHARIRFFKAISQT